MPLEIVRNDITKMAVDAIVNAANESLLGGGGVDGAIHKAAGAGLLNECRTLGGCKTGDAKITAGYNLPAKYVIHTVGPVYKDGNHNEKALLESCYRKSLALAKENNCNSVAFPLISSGVYRYPKDKALKVAIDITSEFLLENDMYVYIVIYDKDAYRISEKLFADITEYIDDNYVDAHTILRGNRAWMSTPASCYLDESSSSSDYDCITVEDINRMLKNNDACISNTLLRNIDELDESFSQMLLRKIDEKGMTDSQCYKKANIDRKLFSKIRGDIQYKPSKTTAIAFAIALELSLSETEEMLRKAGFALSHSNKFDVIIEYFIKTGNYNIFEINEVLFAFDQKLLGG